ncbi:MAG: hypothetical protein U1F44_06515 [Coriobacteriia bacterium]|nr:hypothetical protein [Coriobacteriia bacterium]
MDKDSSIRGRRLALRHAFAADDGVAMITVLGVMVVVTALAIGSFVLASQALHEASRAEGETRAFRVACAGLDTALSTFHPDATGYPFTLATTDGTATVTLTDLGEAGEYELVSEGVGVDGSTETVVQRFFYLNLWEMNFAGTGSQSLTSGSSGLNGSSNIYGPFYVRGNLAVEANMSVMEGPLFVKDAKLSQRASGVIGESGQLVKVYCDGVTDFQKPENVFITGPFLNVPDITLPKLTLDDMRGYATKAQAESVDDKMGSALSPAEPPANLETTSWSSAVYKYYGEATSTIRPLESGITTLTLGTGSFGSWGSIDTTGQVIPAGGVTPYPISYSNLHDDFAYWDEFTSEWDLLFISGTVFVDGPLVVSDDVMYIGNGTIIANGPVTLNGRLRPFSYSTAAVTVNKVGEDKKWALGIVTPGSITMKGKGSNSGTTPIRDNAFDYSGAFYADGTLYVPQPLTSIRGSILSNQMEFSFPNTDLVTNPLLPSYLPDSLPGGDGGFTTPGLWSRR